MKVDILTLCDHAHDHNGRLNITGTFNTLHAPAYPLSRPEFALVARLVLNQTEKGLHNIHYSIGKPDEDLYILPPGQMTADTTHTKGEEVVVNLVVQGSITIPSPGTYLVTLQVDDTVWHSQLHAL